MSLPAPGSTARPACSKSRSRLAARAARAAGALCVAMAMAVPAVAAHTAQAPGRAVMLKLATWNMEWFLTPATFNTLKGNCTRDESTHRWNPRSIPCDVAATLERSGTDLRGMVRVAERLDADVIAVEEVDGAEAASQVFRKYRFCFTGGHEVQNTGFAIRAGLPYRCGPDLMELSLGDQLRRGATLVLFPGTPRELYLLAVHLKSGCARGSLESHARACERLARQAPALREWIAAQKRAGHRFAVLGDFNRELQHEHGEGLWSRIGAGGADDPLVNTADGEIFRNCFPGQTHTGYIDYILLGTELAPSLQRGSFERLTYSPVDAWRLKLSDHCPVAIRLRLD